MPFTFSIPTPAGSRNFSVDPGTSLYFVGANGGGKTRLAVKIEQDLGAKAHRISAHRALNLNPLVPKLSSISANKGLKFGIGRDEPAYGLQHRTGNRWSSKEAVALLNDFDFLLQSLFAEQSITALNTHKAVRNGSQEPAVKTKFEQLCEIWDRLLPHRVLHISGDNVEVKIPGMSNQYSASEMSDGERAVFYLIGQVIMAEEGSLIIFDEPELHIHRSIISRLWDELEAARPDCGMIFISHDLKFIASRTGETFIIRDYRPATGWIIEDVPKDSGFTEELATLILGSRTPILFVEGKNTSLDMAIYRACYPNMTIVARSSCEEVLHAVTTMRANASLTRITCSGIVDADGFRSADDIAFLRAKGVETLPVSEIENLLLLPDVLTEILIHEGHDDNARDIIARSLFDELFTHASEEFNQKSTIMRYCRRKIDQILKRLDFSSSSDLAGLASDFAAKTASIDVSAIARTVKDNLELAISQRNAIDLLKWYDNKGVISIAGKAKSTRKDSFEQWVLRVMLNDVAPSVTAAIKSHLPHLSPA